MDFGYFLQGGSTGSDSRADARPAHRAHSLPLRNDFTFGRGLPVFHLVTTGSAFFLVFSISHFCTMSTTSFGALPSLLRGWR